MNRAQLSALLHQRGNSNQDIGDLCSLYREYLTGLVEAAIQRFAGRDALTEPSVSDSVR